MNKYLTVCEDIKCNGCYACEAICPTSAIVVVDNMRRYSARIDVERCVQCKLCYSVCPNIGGVTLSSPKAWYQGWAEADIREKSSSGGIAYKISQMFLNTGGYVCSCVFDNGEFVFKIISNIKDLCQIQGSKYVKSNPKNVYKDILKLIKKNEKVLFIGLPCQVAAVKNYIGENFRDGLFTIDLICHGSPSPRVLHAYLEENNINLSNVRQIQFRGSGSFGLSIDGNRLDVIPDKYTTAFMEGLCYSENCYLCDFAQKDRGADITLGDCWGTEFENESAMGVSLILCMTHKGETLLDPIRGILRTVDIEKAVKSNKQLNRPSKKHKNYDIFFSNMLNGGRFSSTVNRCCSKVVIKQNIKKFIIKLTDLIIGGFRA